jgi:hypothetical protein
MLAYAVAVPCYCSAQACAATPVVLELVLLVTVYAIVSFSASVSADSVKNFLTKLGMINWGFSPYTVSLIMCCDKKNEEEKDWMIKIV